MRISLSDIYQNIVLETSGSGINLHCIIGFLDKHNSSNEKIIVPIEKIITTVGDNLLIESPIDGESKQIEYINIFNSGSNQSNIKIKMKRNNIFYIISKFSLLANESIHLISDGLKKYNADGELIIYNKGIVTGGSGSGDMNTSVYDVDLTGVVDDSEKLGGQLPSYYASTIYVDSFKYSTILGNYLSTTILQSTHGVPKVSGINVFNISNQNVEIKYSIVSNDIIIESNINLNNHILEIY